MKGREKRGKKEEKKKIAGAPDPRSSIFTLRLPSGEKGRKRRKKKGRKKRVKGSQTIF